MAFILYDESNAPEAALPGLKAMREQYGMIPNLERAMAASPPLLDGHNILWDLFEKTPFSEIERQVVYLTVNYENNCTYCVPWHTLLAKQAGMSKEAIKALRNGSKIPDTKLEALRTLTRSLVQNKGRIVPADLEAFVAAGYEEANALDIVVGIAVKIISNYTNAITAPPLDEQAQPFVWSKPTMADR